MRWRLTIAYDGAGYAGWQSQATRDGIQDHLEAALATICKEPVRVHGAGRTDAGVHALGQIAHFDAPPASGLSSDAWLRALNTCLPPAIRVMKVVAASERFHARFSARGKIYRYRIWTGAVLPPHEFHRAWHVPHPIDLDRLEDALQAFTGRHDFRAFAANRSTRVEDAHRTVFSITKHRRGHAISVDFHGDGFLYKMVRMLTGAGIRVAMGRAELADITDRLAHPASAKWTYVAPADGLWLVRVLY